MTPWFVATEKFGPWDGDKWNKYVAWSGLSQLKELLSLDSMLCRSVLASDKVPDEYWPHIVREDFMLDYFVDLNFLESQLRSKSGFNLLCVVRNPINEESGSGLIPPGFAFQGYDLVEVEGGVSALTNCGGFPDVFANTELSETGLFADFSRAREVQAKLKERHPEDAHADCHLWAIFRKET